MVKGGMTEELEHIELEPAAPRPVRSGWPRRRVVALVAAVALVAVLAGPVRSLSVRASFRHLQSIWLEAKVISAEHVRLRDELDRRAAPQDDALLQRAKRALDAEVARELRRLRRSANGDVRARLDGRLHRFRTTLDSTLRGPRLGSTERVDAEVAALARRFHAPPRRPDVRGRFTTARDALATLSEYADVPMGVTVLAAVGEKLTFIDIDGDSMRTLPPSDTPNDGYLYLAGRPPWLYAEGATPTSRALTPDLQSSVALQPGWGVASANPDRVWLATETTVTEVDRTGHASSPAVRLPPRTFVVGPATAAGLVLGENDGATFAVWDPYRDRIVLRGRGDILGASADVLVSTDPLDESSQLSQLHVLDVRTGRERFVLPPSLWTSPAIFTTDGRSFAVGSVGGITVVDLASGATEHVESPGFGGYGAMAWSPSGRWLFYAEERLAVWDAQRHARTVLRVPRISPGEITSLAVVDS